MPQPAGVVLTENPLASAYTEAWIRILGEQEALAADPLKLARRQRLIEMSRRIEAITEELDDMAADWVRSKFPQIYGMGVSDGALAAGGHPIWTMVHQEAVEELAQSLFTDLLQSTKGVNESTKQLIRAAAKSEALQQAIEGRTAQQASKAMTDLLRAKNIYSVRYANGAKHGMAEYAQMALRTKTATAYNIGTLNAAANEGVLFYEVFDGPDCGWSFHESPDTALGKIVTREEALAFPISHPNCRRSFGARPDIKTKEQAEKLEREQGRVGGGQVTPAQVEAQRLQDQATLLQQQRRAQRAARKGQTKTRRKAGLEKRKKRLDKKTDWVPEEAAPREMVDYTSLNESSRFSPTLAAETAAKLPTPLVDALQDFMYDASPKDVVRQTRRQVADYLQGVKLPPVEQARAEAVLDAMRHAPEVKGTVFRGIAVAESPEEFVARYAKGSTVDLNISSFSSDLKSAQKFTLRGENIGNNTRVIISVSGKKTGLPVRNLSVSRRLYDERETIMGGKFVVKSATVGEPKYGPTVRIQLVWTESL